MMKRHFALIRLEFLLAFILLLSGCASSMSNAKISDAALSGDSTAMWDDGQKLAKKGEEATAKGQEQVNKGRAKVRKGEEKVQKANTAMTRLRIEYQTAARQTGDATTPKAVKAEAKSLKEIGGRWEDAIDAIRDGNKMIDRGNEAVDKGQTTIRKGRKLLDEGSTLMRNSKRLELGVDLLEDTVN